MADHASDHVHGEMDIRAQEAAFHAFTLMTKWGSLAAASLVLLLTVWFCTPGGFLGGLISAVIVAAIGVAVLREKPGKSH